MFIIADDQIWTADL